MQAFSNGIIFNEMCSLCLLYNNYANYVLACCKYLDHAPAVWLNFAAFALLVKNNIGQSTEMFKLTVFLRSHYITVCFVLLIIITQECPVR